MFEITLDNSKLVRGIFEAINAIISETKMKFSPEGIEMHTLDEGRICMVGMKLNKEDFTSYKCEGDNEIGINLDDLVKILKRSGSDDEITLKYNPDVKKLKISMKNSKSKRSRTFSLQLIELGDMGISTEKLEQMQLAATVKIPLAYLEEAIKDADIYSETIQIALKNDTGLIFKASGTIGESETIYEKDDEEISNFEVESDGEGLFPLNYLKNIIKIGSITSEMQLWLESMKPLKMKFDILGSSWFHYFLAPRVEEEEDDYDENY